MPEQLHLPIGKTCPKCGMWKLFKEFSKSGSANDGLQSWCKTCFKEHHLAAPERLKLRQEEFHKNNTHKLCTKCGKIKSLDGFFQHRGKPDGLQSQCKECNNIYRAEHKEKWDGYAQEYRKVHKEETAVYNSIYRAENKEAIAAGQKRWQQANLGKVRVSNQRRRARKASIPGSYSAIEWEALCAQYPDICPCCKKPWSEVGKPTVDHVIPITWLGSTNGISNIQPLCGLCNSAKGNRSDGSYLV